MKRLIICVSILFIFATSGHAEMTGQKGNEGHEMMKGEGQQMQMMCPKMQQMHGQGMMQGGGHQMPMMGQMMGHGMMMQDMMQMMMDIMNMQEKIITGVKASEKKEMLDRIKDMKTRMQNKMSMQQCMMGAMMGGMMCPMMGGGMAGHSAPSESKESEETGTAPKEDTHGH